MASPNPLYAGEKKAAALLDMTVSEFLQHVAAHHLPPGREIVPGVRRWDVEELRRIGSGDPAAGYGEIPW